MRAFVSCLVYLSGPAMNEPIVTRETGLPVARELAEMLLTQQDIANSLAVLTAWIEGDASEDSDPNSRAHAIRGSLFRDGITQFVGCFDSKNAFPLVVETVYPAVEGIDAYFRWLRALRNSYTAHRHGGARQCVVGILINPISGEYLGRDNRFATYLGPNQEGQSDLLSILSMASRYVAERISALEQQFDAEVQSIAPSDRLKLPAAALQPQGPTSMGKSRGDIRKGIERERDDERCA
jgi:hypothetical protein